MRSMLLVSVLALLAMWPTNASAQVTEDPLPSTSCTSTLARNVPFVNAEYGYCLVHDSRWLVVEDSSASVNFRIPPEGWPESMALNVAVTDTEVDASLDEVIDAFLETLIPEQQQFSNVQILERSDALVAGQPAKLLVFGANLEAGDELLDVEGRVYVLLSPVRKLYVLTFILDTTRVPAKAYSSTVDSMVASFTLTSPARQ